MRTPMDPVLLAESLQNRQLFEYILTFSLQTHMRQKCRYVPEEHRIITRSGNTIIVTITSNCYFADSLNRTTVNVLHVASHDYCGHD